MTILAALLLTGGTICELVALNAARLDLNEDTRLRLWLFGLGLVAQTAANLLAL